VARKKVAIAQIDGKLPNLALMKLSAWHKSQGDEVAFFLPSESYDLVYASKVFTFSADDPYLPQRVVKGGTGYNVVAALPDEVEHIYPDYEMWGINYAIGFASRGCVRNCPWCVVPRKEGKIKANADIYEFWRGQDELVLLDGNITALPDHFKLICEQIMRENIRVEFNQGLDIRCVDADMAKLISRLRLRTNLRFGFDSSVYADAVERGVKLLQSGGVSKNKLMFYLLYNFNDTPQDLYERLVLLQRLGVDAYPMRYRALDGKEEGRNSGWNSFQLDGFSRLVRQHSWGRMVVFGRMGLERFYSIFGNSEQEFVGRIGAEGRYCEKQMRLS